MRKSALRDKSNSIPLPHTGLERNTLGIHFDGGRAVRVRWVNQWGTTLPWFNAGGALVQWR